MRPLANGLTPLAAALAVAFTPLSAVATTYVVTNVADSGPGSLRDAMSTALSNCMTDPSPVINFNVAGPGPFVISPSTPLPAMNCSGPFQPVIDGYTQPGAAMNTSTTGFNAVLPVVLDGGSLSFGSCGLEFDDFGYGGFMGVHGLEIRNFIYGGFYQAVCGPLELYGDLIHDNNYGAAAGDQSMIGDNTPSERNVFGNHSQIAISVAYGGTASIRNNLIGTLDGVTAAPNGTGIYWGGSGPSSDITGNVISGNSNFGINLSSDAGTTIFNNYIGTDSTGTAALPNLIGIELDYADGTNIQTNVISGNTNFGIVGNNLGVGFPPSPITIGNNTFGMDVSGTFAVPNNTAVFLVCGTGPVVQANLISGNLEAVGFSGIDNGIFDGNRIGVDAGGANAIASGLYGLVIDGGTCSPQTGSHSVISNNTIANSGDGVLLNGGVGNTITQNSIYNNSNKNININNTTGPLPNDPGDTDSGPNNQQNYPVITSVVNSGGNTIVFWTLDSAAGDPFNLEIFANPAPGQPAGKQFIALGFTPGGSASGNTSFAGTFDNISMTATDNATGDTSEFSPIVSVVPAPALSISPPSLSFGNVVVGATSASQSSTITSTGNAPLQFTAFSSPSCPGGPICYGGPFICSTTCNTAPASYAPSTSCNVTASFAPTALGPASTNIEFCDNTSGSPHHITIDGTGVAAPTIVVSPPNVDFGNVLVGDQSAPQTFTITNSSASSANLTPFSVSGPYVLVANTCSTTLAASASCDADIAFAPTQPGFASGMLQAGSGSAGLYGTGTQQAQIVLPDALDLGAYTLGAPPIHQSVALANSGNAVLTFSMLSVTAPFTLASDCPTNLPPGGSCQLDIGFSATTAGDFSGTLSIVTNAPNGSRDVPVKAHAQPRPIPILRLAPVAIGFGDRLVGTLSASQRVTITNDGGAAAIFGAITPSTDYVVTSTNCGASLAPQASCFADVAFRALGFGLRNGALTVTSNAEASTSSVSLSGTGCRPFLPTANRLGNRSNCAP